MTKILDLLQGLRDQWRWRGVERPPFATEPACSRAGVGLGDYPRPSTLRPDAREIVIRWDTAEVARTRRALRVLETAHPPQYLPWEDLDRRLFQADPALRTANGRVRPVVTGRWRPSPIQRGLELSTAAGGRPVANCVAFQPSSLDCRVGGARVTPQPGGFYGGWITPELVGPFKGDPGSAGW